MGQRFEQAQALDARASASPSLAEAQALHAEADRLRRTAQTGFLAAWARQPFFRN